LIFSCFYFLLLGIFEQTRCMKIHDDSNNIKKFKVFSFNAIGYPFA